MDPEIEVSQVSSSSDDEEEEDDSPSDNIDFNRAKRSSFIMPSRHQPPPELVRRESDTKMSKTGVNVFVRFRPDCTEEEAEGYSCVTYYPDGKSVELKHESRTYTHKFRRVLPPECTQEQLFLASALPLVDSILDGYNAAIIAYGQTGSGKTHTLLGPGYDQSENVGRADPELRGVAPRLMQSLFHQVYSSVAPDVLYEVYVSYIQIYNEKIHDLLNSAKSSLKIYQDLSKGLWVTDATSVPTRNVNEVLRQLELGTHNRVTAATKSNITSSRSHALLILTIKKNLVLSGIHRASQVYITDLCGSERLSKTGAEHQRLYEAQNINKSLLALGNVIGALVEKRQHVPYRNSKLTHILQNSFGGNSLTSLILCCSSNSMNCQETLSTLRFGSRASQVENRPTVNQHHSVDDLRRMLNEANSKILSQQRVIRSQNEKLIQMETILNELYSMVGMKNLKALEVKYQAPLPRVMQAAFTKMNVNTFGCIVHFLHPVEVIKLFGVCKHFHNTLRNDRVWSYFLTQLRSGEIQLKNIAPEEWPDHAGVHGSYWDAIFKVLKEKIVSRIVRPVQEGPSSGLRLFAAS